MQKKKCIFSTYDDNQSNDEIFIEHLIEQERAADEMRKQIYEQEIQKAIFFPGPESFYGIGEYVKIAVPSTIMTCMDWWSFEIMIFTSGFFGVTAQAAQILLMNIMMLVHKFGEGMSMTAPALIGKQIGYGNVKQGKFNLRAFRIHGLILISFLALFIHFYKEKLLYMLTDIEGVRDSAMIVLFLLTLNVYPELYKNQLKGVIKSLGL